MLFDIVYMIRTFPTLANTSAASCVCDLSNLYNQLVVHEILGSGAFQSKKLSFISAKDLALSSNCISFLVDELPYLRSQVLLHTTTEAIQKTLESQFDKLA